jgi:hypothetical protein
LFREFAAFATISVTSSPSSSRSSLVQKQQSEYINMDERGESSVVVRDTGGSGFCETVLTYLSMFMVLITLPISIWMVVKQVQVREVETIRL